MATLVESIRQILIDTPEVYALTGERIIADRLPQGFPTPAILLWIVRENALDAIDGPLGMDQPIVRVACYAKTRIDATNLRLLVRTALSGYHGVVAGLFIKGIAQQRGEGETFDTDRVRTGTDEYRFVSYQNFRVSYDYEAIT